MSDAGFNPEYVAGSSTYTSQLTTERRWYSEARITISAAPFLDQYHFVRAWGPGARDRAVAKARRWAASRKRANERYLAGLRADRIDL